MTEPLFSFSQFPFLRTIKPATTRSTSRCEFGWGEESGSPHTQNDWTKIKMQLERNALFSLSKGSSISRINTCRCHGPTAPDVPCRSPPRSPHSSIPSSRPALPIPTLASRVLWKTWKISMTVVSILKYLLGSQSFWHSLLLTIVRKKLSRHSRSMFVTYPQKIFTIAAQRHIRATSQCWFSGIVYSAKVKFPTYSSQTSHGRSSPLSAHPTAHRRLCAEDPAPLLIWSYLWRRFVRHSAVNSRPYHLLSGDLIRLQRLSRKGFFLPSFETYSNQRSERFVQSSWNSHGVRFFVGVIFFPIQPVCFVWFPPITGLCIL